MTILNFPDDPAAVGNIYVAPNGVTYYYDGVKWIGENSANHVSDRITAGDKSLIIDTDGNITFPDSSTFYTVDVGSIWLSTGPANEGTNKNLILSTGFETNTILIPGTTYADPVGSGNTYPILISGKNGVTINSGGDAHANDPGKDWKFGADGTIQFPDNTLDSGNNSLSVISTNYVDISYYNGTDPDTWGAGTVIDSVVGVDRYGAYLSTVAINNDGTDANVGTWGVDINGNLVTNVLHEFADDTTGDITDSAGNSLVYVPTTDTAPSHDHNGLLWFNTEDGRAYIRYNHQWVDANPPVIPAVSTYLDGLVVEGQTISSIDYVESAVKIGGDLIPDEDLMYNLGSPTNQWKHLYVDSHTIYMGGKAVSLTDQGLQIDGRTAVYEIDGGMASTWLTA